MDEHAAATIERESTKKKFFSKEVLQKFAAFGALIILFIFFSIFGRNFFSIDNLLSIALQTSIIAFIGIGVTFAIITAGIDLGIGSVLALSGVVAGLSMQAGISPVFAILFGLLTGVGCGMINAFFITKGGLPPFIATLGMMGIARGVALYITNAAPIYDFPPSFEIIGGKIASIIPVPVIIMIVVAILFGFILAKTKLGTYVYAIGSNEEAARLSGINVHVIKFAVYAISGLLAAVAGIVLASRLVTAQPTAGGGYELDAIASAVIGGSSLMGGIGTITGTLIGAFMIGVLRNGLNIMGVSSFIQQIVIGAVIIGAVFVDQLRNKMRTKVK
jgi:ribose transport system permease protein